MKALNRKEVLVNAKANGTLDRFKPLTRDEAFTKKALGLGGSASAIPYFFIKYTTDNMGGVFLKCTYDEVTEAFNAGKELFLMGEESAAGYNYPFVSIEPYGSDNRPVFRFGKTFYNYIEDGDADVLNLLTISIYPNSTAQLHFRALKLAHDEFN